MNTQHFGSFRKSTYSDDGPNCVEVAFAPAGRRTALRDSKNTAAGHLDVPTSSFRALVSTLADRQSA